MPLLFGPAALEQALTAHLGLAHLAVDRRGEPEVPLGEEVLGAGLHHRDAHFFAERAGHEDEGEVESALLKERERVFAAEWGKT